MRKLLCLSVCISLLFACNSEPEPPLGLDLPELSVRDSRAFEQNGQTNMIFEVLADGVVEQPINFTFELSGITATPDEDFTSGNGSSVLGVGTNKVNITVVILDDAINEVDEKLKLSLTGASNATISDGEAIGIIQDNDAPIATDSRGYITGNSFFGYNLVWEEEFDGATLDEQSFNYELENGCPDLCGWGNSELQWYTKDKNNIDLINGDLVITATQSGPNAFNSARIQTKGKKEFQYGRIDVRARLPEGQGIWPAIWMLGKNIDDVGWPACGEIDIMELVGHMPKTVLGTAHWGAQGAANSTFLSGGYFLDEKFSEKFHVFSIVWEWNELVWYVDETKFQTITPADMKGEEYRFNQPFFFIFNVAVGGLLPGNPDSTTVFPQPMDIDYIRVFQ